MAIGAGKAHEHERKQSMSWNGKKVMRAAVGAALSATLALGGAMPSVALADPGDGKGTLTINKASSGNNVSSYKAIKIFKADVYQDNGKWVASELTWASDAVKTAVIGAIKEVDSTYTSEDPQVAADFLVSHIQGSDNTTIVSPTDFANTLASKIGYAVADAGNTLQADYTLQPDVKMNDVAEGYYLVIVDPSELAAAGSAGTSPILLMVGEGQDVTVTEKVTVPTLTKTVTEDSAPTAVTQFADAQAGQEVHFKLAGTVAGNVAGYGTYEYEFIDTLSKGLTLKMAGQSVANGDVTVKVVNTDSSTTPATVSIYTVTSGYTTTYTANETDSTAHDLKVTFANLKAAQGTKEGETTPAAIPIDASSVVTVEYVASLNSNAVAGLSAGNPNKAVLEYSDMPNYGHRGKTEFVEAKVYELALKLVKVDKEYELDNNANTNTVLPGAKFTIQATKTDEGEANDRKFLKRDGTFGASILPETTAADYNDYIFETDTNGSFTVKGLDGGKALDTNNTTYTYTIHEVAAPANYDTIAEDLRLNIKVNKDQTTLQPSSITTTLSGGEGDGTNTMGDSNAPNNKGTRVTTDTDGTIVITATNKKQEELPLTGLPGITMVYVVGGAILAVSLVVIVRRRIAEKE